MRPSILVLLLSLAASGVLAAFALAGAASASQAGIEPGPRIGKEAPVMVELFTSEGCSSCPPADDLLMEIHKAHPIANAEVFVLSEHVDYWNRLGWVDPFSSAQFSDRQKGYAARFGQSGIYTPQMVVDGREELVGSDRVPRPAGHCRCGQPTQGHSSPCPCSRQTRRSWQPGQARRPGRKAVRHPAQKCSGRIPGGHGK